MNTQEIYTILYNRMVRMSQSLVFKEKHTTDSKGCMEMGRALDVMSEMLKVVTDDFTTIGEYLSDNKGPRTPLTTFTKVLQETISDFMTLTSGQHKINPYYLAYAKRHGMVAEETTMAEWDKTQESCRVRDMFAQQWVAECPDVHDVTLAQLKNWMTEYLVPIYVGGIADDMHFEWYGMRQPILRVIFRELLKNAILFSDPTVRRPIVLTWERSGDNLTLRCTNYSTRATRMREKSKGDNVGTLMLTHIVEKLGGEFKTDFYNDLESSAVIQIPGWYTAKQ